MREYMADYNLTRLNFLIVDDNKHMRALVKSILHALGVKNCVEAGDGADAFKELRHFPADVIICDWNMSPLDGLDFVRMVRTGEARCAAPPGAWVVEPWRARPRLWRPCWPRRRAPGPRPAG